MELMENILRIKGNLFLIPAEKLDSQANDPGYKTSLIYLLACLVLSIPFYLLGAMLDGILAISVIATPFYIGMGVVMAYISFSIYHVLLRLVGGRAPLRRTIQMMIYGMTPSIIFGSIPCIGALAALIALANIILGAVRVHGISLLRSVVALFILPLLIIIAIWLVFMLFFASLSTSLGYL